ncbi:MAG: acyltransferase [Planctomycetota bacterium]|nr:acyltransferase [Planctomycetota bacterium]
MDREPVKHESKRIILLDVYRVIAAIAVVMFHLAYRGTLRGEYCDVGFGDFGELFKYSYLGVDFFFMISGFVISFSAAQGNAGKFFYSRVIRLLPGFLICCTLTYLTILLLDDGRMAVSLWTYLLNLTMVSGYFGIPYVDGSYWSLGIEIHFYAMVGVILWMNGSKHLESCIRLWLMASILLYCYHIRGINRIALSEYAPLFSAGATFYFCYAQKVTYARLLTLFASFCATIAWTRVKAHNLSTFYEQDFDYRITILIDACFFLAFVLVILRMEPPWPRFWIVAGTATYPLYLLHQHMGFIGMNFLATSLSAPVNLSIVLLVIVALSLFVSEFLEPIARRQVPRLLSNLSCAMRTLGTLRLPRAENDPIFSPSSRFGNARGGD